MDKFSRLFADHKAGHLRGIASICSAHPLVIEATFRHAMGRGREMVLVEATSNQVNQFGGYTGMTPASFRAFVESIAQRVGFPCEAIILGGDHLGPNAWTALSAAEAMERACRMVGDYVSAGFRKIHLDCSMSCADDPEPLDKEVIAGRAATLCAAAEAAFSGPRELAPLYVIGTEVPVPGGAAEDLDVLAVTTPADALETIAIHERLFHAAGLSDAWTRVIATVVQPGVEFDHDKVIDYDPAAAADLAASIQPVEGLVFEAHSTDYQTPDALKALVRDHFAILKVGPGVTFALREALWALDAMEGELVEGAQRARLRDTALDRMRSDPAHWRKYYHGEGEALGFQLQYSLSDRIRYYWPDPAISVAQERLFANLRASPPPLPLISQYLPSAYHAVRAGAASADPADLTMAHIAATLDDYDGACNPDA